MGNNEAVIYDLEFTTWPEAYTRQWSKSNESREIIRIGAVNIDLDSLQEIGSLDVFVKPSVNPLLSDYCIKLTGITDEQIQAEGIELHEAIHRFVDFVGDKRIYSYGADIVAILENLRINNITYNAKTLKSNRTIVINEYHNYSYNQTDPYLQSNVVEVFLYGSGLFNTIGRISEGVRVEINLNRNSVQLTAIDIKHWFFINAPETQGKPSGKIAKALGINELKGNVHDPLFDARCVHMGLRELVLSRHIENPLK